MAEVTAELQSLLEKVYQERGVDFRECSVTTLTRRFVRRLQARRVATHADYACVLEQDPAEFDRLFHDLTSKVTSFFRDALAFQAVQRVVLPALLSIAEPGHSAL